MGLFDGLFRRSRKPAAPPLAPLPRETGSGRRISPQPELAAVPVLRVGNIQGTGGRERQEDSFAVLNAASPDLIQTQGLLAVVADGMGGMANGKEASQFTVDLLLEQFGCRDADMPVPNWLYGCAFSASDQVFSRFAGASGTTLTAVHILGDRLHWLSVGDSAIYLMRAGGVYQLNREHTYLNRLYAGELEQETIDKTRAELDPDARRLTSFVGIDRLQEVDLNLRALTLKRGDAVLLCSDGISGILTPPELTEAMSMEPDQGAALLETMVLEKQVPEQDNYTGVLISYR